MKKKIIFISILITLFFNLHLLAQNWVIGGNVVPVGGGSLGSNNNQPVIFETNNIERGRLAPNGRWGIGITNPAAKVHIRNAATLNPFRVDVGTTIALLVNGNRQFGIGTTTPDNTLHVFKGNAGIVTANVNSPLVVENSTDCFLSLLAPDANETGILFGKPASGVSGGIVYSNSSLQNGLQFRTNGNVTRMSLTSAGNLGVGVASPTSRLQVAGDLNFDGEATGIIFDDAQFIRDGTASLDIETHGNLVPDNDGLHSLGTTALTWSSVHALQYFSSLALGPNANVQNLKSGLKEILKLRPISYQDSRNGNVQKFGLVEKEVQQVVPEVVRDWQVSADEAGMFSKVPASKIAIEYNAFIPLLIKGMQEQQQKIITLEERIAKLEKALNSVSSNDVSGKQIAGVSLLQNQPNPFNQNTIIRYTVPAGANAQIMIYDATGRLIKTLQATQSGQSQINASELKPGAYKYTLVTNGNVVASKTMVLLK
jgi:hypothetical protein